LLAISKAPQSRGNPSEERTRDLIVAAAKEAGITLPDNVGRNTFISMHGAYHESIDKTALEADNSSEIIKKDYLDLVTREEAEKFWNIRPLVNTPTNGTKNFGVSKPIKSKKTETTSSVAKSSTPVTKVESAKSSPEENFAKIIELNKTKGPVPFRPTQRDYKRQEKLVCRRFSVGNNF
jgi:hypothetical protein